MKKQKYKFPEPSCRSCPYHQEAGLTRYCRGFKGRKPKRFRKADPIFKAPKWCPRRLTSPICRIYGFANEQCEYMERLSAAGFDPKQPYIYPMESHYTLRRELSIGMNAKQFFQASQSELLEDLLPDLDVSLGEVIEIDDGLRPYYFYYWGLLRLIPILTFHPLKITKMKEDN